MTDQEISERCAICDQPSVGNNTLQLRSLGMTTVTMHRYLCPEDEEWGKDEDR